jgi:hypothetical protein
MSVEGRRGRRALVFDRFGGAGASQLFMIYSHMKRSRFTPLSLKTKHSENVNGAVLFPSTP